MPAHDREREEKQNNNSFDLALRPLETKVGVRLNGHGRRECRRAFEQNEAGFLSLLREVERCADDPGLRNALALLVSRVREGDHLEPLLQAKGDDDGDTGDTAYVKA